jgi:hypothetical protein
MHLASPQRNTDVNAQGLQIGYKNILTQRRPTTVEANFLHRNALQLCYLLLQEPTENFKQPILLQSQLREQLEKKKPNGLHTDNG